MGGGPRPVYASSVLRLSSFNAVLQIIHRDPTERSKRLRLDAAKGYFSAELKWKVTGVETVDTNAPLTLNYCPVSIWFTVMNTESGSGSGSGSGGRK